MLIIVKKGDVVARKSYNKDVIFIVDMIIKNKIAILTGLTARLKADANIEDLEVLGRKEIEKYFNKIERGKLEKVNSNQVAKNNFFTRTNKIVYTGKILHLDGDSCLDNKNSHWLKILNLKKKYLTTN